MKKKKNREKVVKLDDEVKIEYEGIDWYLILGAIILSPLTTLVGIVFVLIKFVADIILLSIPYINLMRFIRILENITTEDSKNFKDLDLLDLETYNETKNKKVLVKEIIDNKR